MKKLGKLGRALALAIAKGDGWVSRCRLLILLTKHIRVNRGWSKFTGVKHQIQIRHDGRRAEITLRDNGTDAHVFADIFGNECYRVPSPHIAPRVIYDAGANIGLASVFFHLSYPDARLYSFEPVEHAMCSKNIKAESTKLFPLALGKENGVCNILVDPLNSGGHRLERYDERANLKQLPVTLRRLDQLITEEKLPMPEMLKIDAEGAECDIIEGLGAMVNGLKMVVAETQSAKNHRWIKEHLKQAGFRQFSETITYADASQPHQAYSILWAFRDATAVTGAST